MSWFTAWIKKDTTKIILKGALSILKVFMGEVANEAWQKVTVAVNKAEGMPLTGPQKAQYVLQDVKAQWPEIKTHLANLMVELAVAYLKEGLIKK